MQPKSCATDTFRSHAWALHAWGLGLIKPATAGGLVYSSTHLQTSLSSSADLGTRSLCPVYLRTHLKCLHIPGDPVLELLTPLSSLLCLTRGTPSLGFRLRTSSPGETTCICTPNALKTFRCVLHTRSRHPCRPSHCVPNYTTVGLILFSVS